MTEEEIKLLNKIEGLPRKLNIEIRGLILAEICLRKENQQLKQQLEQRDNIIKKAREFVNEYEKNRNCFKWNEQDYIDTINEIKKILNIDKGE